MFCHNCGSKLKKSDKVCGACGVPADQAEVCGGFWGLVGDMPAVPPAAPEAPAKQPVNSVSAEVQSPGKYAAMKDPKTVWKGLVAVLAVLLLVQTIRVGVLSSGLDSQESLAGQYREMYDQAAQENEVLKKQLNGVTGELQTLSDDVAQIKEILEAEETTEPTDPVEPEDPEKTEVPGESTAPQEDHSGETEPQDTQAPSAETTEGAN